MSFKEKIIHYLILTPIAWSLYFVACLAFDINTLIKKIKQWKISH